jgi:hypothetical protein
VGEFSFSFISSYLKRIFYVRLVSFFLNPLSHYICLNVNISSVIFYISKRRYFFRKFEIGSLYSTGSKRTFVDTKGIYPNSSTSVSKHCLLVSNLVKCSLVADCCLYKFAISSLYGFLSSIFTGACLVMCDTTKLRTMS